MVPRAPVAGSHLYCGAWFSVGSCMCNYGNGRPASPNSDGPPPRNQTPRKTGVPRRSAVVDSDRSFAAKLLGMPN